MHILQYLEQNMLKMIIFDQKKKWGAALFINSRKRGATVLTWSTKSAHSTYICIFVQKLHIT